MGVRGRRRDLLECRLELGANVVADWETCSSPRAYDLAGRPDGTYPFSLRGRNAAGTVGAAVESTTCSTGRRRRARARRLAPRDRQRPTPAW